MATKALVKTKTKKYVEGIKIFNDLDVEICKVPFHTISELGRNPILIETIIEKNCECTN